MLIFFIICNTVLMFVATLLFNKAFFVRIYGADNTNIWDKGFVVKVLLILAFIVEMLAYMLIMQSATAFRAVAQSIHFAS